MPHQAEPIAIVGAGCRFPGGANSPEMFWRLLSSGSDAICEVPKDRWNIDRFYSPDVQKPGKIYVRKGGFLTEPIDRFDAAFFGISPREAVSMDPQQRFLLEVAWEALEDAGNPADELAGSAVGVYVGGFTLDSLIHHMSPLSRDSIGSHSATGSSMTMLANRISYCFDFRGPSVSLDTACSSSLVATHMACSAIWNGECSMALVGGVNIMMRPEYPMVMCKGRFLAPDGYSKSFDARADGYSRGEGAAVVLLKPLSAAQANNDHIYAVICGSGINQDGRTDGITVPNPEAQQALIRDIYTRSGIPFEGVSYVEAHGTGTPVGDPIEAFAIGSTISAGRDANNACFMGSVKASIGHLEAAAGVAGLIKAALCLHHGEIPPQANLVEPNPAIPFAELGLRLPQRLEPMPKGDGPVYVGVNSFGYGGTNAHVVLREAPAQEEQESPKQTGSAGILTLSARDPAALTASAEAYVKLLERPDAPVFEDVCYSANVRRSHHEHRLAVVAESAQQAAAELDAFVKHGRSPMTITGKAAQREQRKPVFVFTGMGPQWWRMGRELLQSSPVFRNAAHEVDECFRAVAGWSILDELQVEQAVSRMAETQVAQPANFLIQVALTKQLGDWKVFPAAIVGHSVGEVASAYASGALSLDDAVLVSYHRSRLQQRAAGKGKMLATGLTMSQAETLLGRWADKVSIAAINGSADTTLSGDPSALNEIAEDLAEKQLFHRMLKVEVAYHSPQMDLLKDELLDSLKNIRPRLTTIPVYSTVTGRIVEDAAFDGKYWCDNVREPVRFADAIDTIMKDGHEAFLEVGPHPVLAASLRDAFRRHNGRGVALATLRRGEAEYPALLQSIGGLHVNGYDAGLRDLAGEGRRYVKLPAYAWQRNSFWKETPAAESDRIGKQPHPLLGNRLPGPAPTWEGELNSHTAAYLFDHIIDGVSLFPGAGYIEQGLAIHRLTEDAEAGMLEDVAFLQALIIQPDKDVVLRATFDEASREFRIYCQQGEDSSRWMLHATGRISASPPFPASSIDLKDIKQRCVDYLAAEPFYARLAAHRLQYGPSFQGVKHLWRRSGEVLAEIEAPSKQNGAESDYLLDPALLDAGVQALMAGLDENTEDERAYLPVSIGRIVHRRRLNGRCWSHCRITGSTQDSITGDIVYCDDNGEVIAEIKDLQCKAAASSKADAAGRMKSLSYILTWEEAALDCPVSKAGNWLIFGAAADQSSLIARRLSDLGASPVTVRLKDCPDRKSFERMLCEVTPCEGVVYLPAAGQAVETSTLSQERPHVQFLYLLQALASHADRQDAPRLYVVTSGAQQVNDEAIKDLELSFTTGLSRTVLNELPALRCTLVDLDGQNAIEQLTGELLSDSAETSVALRGATRYVQRLKPLAQHENQDEEKEQVLITADEAGAFHLELGTQGRFEELRFRQRPRQAPMAGEVEIAIRAAALNFKDVLKVLGMLPAKALEGTFHGTGLGMEAAGVIVATGEGVTEFQVGDAVVASVRDSFSSHITVAVDSMFALRKLESMSFADAASLPVTFMTAYYCLHELARLQKGETVLIHAAAGGVGLAAIQVAQWLGANIIATAGRDEKRAYLRSLGVEHALNSRTLEFADQVMDITHGRGVDVVLNSLAGETFLKTMQIVAPLGRFIEIGKRDIVENTRLPMLPFNKNLSFSAIDLDRMMQEKPELIRYLFRSVWERFEAGDFKLTPVEVFPVSAIADAFRHMAASKHTGKIIISFEDLAGVSVVPLQQKHSLFKADASYLITGGMGGFGLEVANWMAREGVRHLVLAGRSGAKSEQAQETVRALREQGVSVRVMLADISKEDDVKSLLREIARSEPPLRGVFHAAAVLDDALLSNLDEARLQRVIEPKAHGAWYLHKHTSGHNLDHFVLFSSIAAILGNPGQGNYFAANVFLDSLAHYRRSLGLPALSVNWGALANAGMAVSGHEIAEHLARIGMNNVNPAEACSALGWALEKDEAQLAFADIDWKRWRQAYPATAGLPCFTYVTGAAASESDAPAQKLRAELLAAQAGERSNIVAGIIAEFLAEIMRLPVERVDISEPLSDMGLDSLMGVELQINVNTTFGIDVPVLLLAKGGNIIAVSKAILVRMGIDHAQDAE